MQQDPKQTSDNKSEDYLSKADLYRGCLGDFVHDRKDETLVAFTIILAFSTIFLWVATRDLVSSAEKTARAQLRAYISVVNGDIRLVNGTEGIIGVRAQIKIKNFGQTPAHRSASWAIVRVLDAETTQFSMEKSDRPPSFAVMGPSAETIVSRLVAISAADLDDIHSGEKRIFMWGRVEYIDAFNKRRWFRICHRNSRVPEAPGHWGMEPYGDGEQGN